MPTCGGKMWIAGFVFLLQSNESAVMPKNVTGFQLGLILDYFR